MQISTEPTEPSPRHRLIPAPVSLTATSDYRTTANIECSGTYGRASLKVKRVPGKNIDAELLVNGRKYTLEGNLNKVQLGTQNTASVYAYCGKAMI